MGGAKGFKEVIGLSGSPSFFASGAQDVGIARRPYSQVGFANPWQFRNSIFFYLRPEIQINLRRVWPDVNT
jgi:hypothetical protein